MRDPAPNRRTPLWLEPFWVVSILCYLLHRIWQGWMPAPGWMASYWNDIWMLPCALPLVLRLYEACGLRRPNPKPSLLEILSHGMLWAVMAEGIGPLLFTHAVRDPWDVVAYGVGGILLWIRWHVPQPMFKGDVCRV